MPLNRAAGAQEAGIGMPGMRRRRPIRLPGSVVLTLFRGHDPGNVGLIVGHASPFGEDRHQRGVGSQSFHADPGFGERSSPGGIDQPDRDMLVGGQLFPKKYATAENFAAVSGVHAVHDGVVIADRVIRRLLLDQQQTESG